MKKEDWKAIRTAKEVRAFYDGYGEEDLISEYIEAMEELIEQYGAGDGYRTCSLCAILRLCTPCPWVVLTGESCLAAGITKFVIIKKGLEKERIMSLRKWIKIYKRADVLKGRVK